MHRAGQSGPLAGRPGHRVGGGSKPVGMHDCVTEARRDVWSTRSWNGSFTNREAKVESEDDQARGCHVSARVGSRSYVAQAGDMPGLTADSGQRVSLGSVEPP